MATLLPQTVVDYQNFVVGIEAVVAELAAGSYFVGYIVDYNPVGSAVFVFVVAVGSLLGFVAGTELVVAVAKPDVGSFDFGLGYIVDVAVVIVELDHCTLIVDFVDPLQVRMPTSCVSVHIGYMLQRYT